LEEFKIERASRTGRIEDIKGGPKAGHSYEQDINRNGEVNRALSEFNHGDTVVVQSQVVRVIVSAFRPKRAW